MTYYTTTVQQVKQLPETAECIVLAQLDERFNFFETQQVKEVEVFGGARRQETFEPDLFTKFGKLKVMVVIGITIRAPFNLPHRIEKFFVVNKQNDYPNAVFQADEIYSINTNLDTLSYKSIENNQFNYNIMKMHNQYINLDQAVRNSKQQKQKVNHVSFEEIIAEFEKLKDKKLISMIANYLKVPFTEVDTIPNMDEKRAIQKFVELSGFNAIELGKMLIEKFGLKYSDLFREIITSQLPEVQKSQFLCKFKDVDLKEFFRALSKETKYLYQIHQFNEHFWQKFAESDEFDLTQKKTIFSEFCQFCANIDAVLYQLMDLENQDDQKLFIQLILKSKQKIDEESQVPTDKNMKFNFSSLVLKKNPLLINHLLKNNPFQIEEDELFILTCQTPNPIEHFQKFKKINYSLIFHAKNTLLNQIKLLQQIKLSSSAIIQSLLNDQKIEDDKRDRILSYLHATQLVELKERLNRAEQTLLISKEKVTRFAQIVKEKDLK